MSAVEFALAVSAVKPIQDTGSATGWPDSATVGIAAFALLASCVFGVLNRRTAQNALTLSRRQEARRDERLDLYLIGTSARRRATTGDRLLEFNVQITNPADRGNTLTAAELRVTYLLPGGVVAAIKVPNTEALDDPLATPGLSLLQVPLRLDATDGKSGWLRYRLDGALLKDREIDRYDLLIRDVHGIEESRQVVTVNDVVA